MVYKYNFLALSSSKLILTCHETNEAKAEAGRQAQRHMWENSGSAGRYKRAGSRLHSLGLTGAIRLLAKMPGLRMRNQGSAEKTADEIYPPLQEG